MTRVVNCTHALLLTLAVVVADGTLGPLFANGTQCQVGNASCTVPPQPAGSICYCGTTAGTTVGTTTETTEG